MNLFRFLCEMHNGPEVLVTEQKMPKQVAREPPKRGRGAALVLAGQWRFRRRSVLALRRFVAEPLQAKVFAAVSRFEPENISAQAARAALHEVARVLHAELHPDAVDVHHTGGGWLLAPADGRTGTSLLAMRKLDMALNLVERFEAERGEPFRWIVYCRLDMAPGHLAAAYFRRYRLLKDNTAPVLRYQGPQTFAYHGLTVQGVATATMENIASLEPCDWGCFSDVSDSRRLRWRRDGFRLTHLTSGLRRGVLQWVRGYGTHLHPAMKRQSVAWQATSPALVIAELAGANASSDEVRLWHRNDQFMNSPLPLSPATIRRRQCLIKGHCRGLQTAKGHHPENQQQPAMAPSEHQQPIRAELQALNLNLKACLEGPAGEVQKVAEVYVQLEDDAAD
ncbi:hypothetical protein AK812_SmicGene11432 [Symbiodinium microadriaticum]|uniref:Uncharacterized protein n=1 Tax=Symbiodinium microadriaticum TaxID=2951 RepID=A0A1Q9ED97_SYMMI|nr:hypothetical protein AK812_SmicGene11432 [Symbiodinium microadriaticum]